MSKTPFEAYTYIGEGTRFYDYAYKSLHWLLSGKKRCDRIILWLCGSQR